MLSGIMKGSWIRVQVCLTMMPMLVTVQDTPPQGAFLEGYTAHILVKGLWTWNVPLSSIPGAYCFICPPLTRSVRKVRTSQPNPSAPVTKEESKGTSESFKTGQNQNVPGVSTYIHKGCAHPTPGSMSQKTHVQCTICTTRQKSLKGSLTLTASAMTSSSSVSSRALLSAPLKKWEAGIILPSSSWMFFTSSCKKKASQHPRLASSQGEEQFHMQYCVGHPTHFSNPHHEKGTRLMRKRDIQSRHAGYSMDTEGMVELTSPGHLPQPSSHFFLSLMILSFL